MNVLESHGIGLDQWLSFDKVGVVNSRARWGAVEVCHNRFLWMSG
ncbi:hypothetical protein N836_33875 [Leptolyngbya sp. Heron Island J]|nr:hypothetical protein N836_33875 [Leptolyngbya sp. Heron Island J]